MYTPSSTAFLRPTRGGGFEFVEYDNNAFPYPQTIGSTASSINGLGPADETMINTIFIMPNKGTDSTATMMIVVDEVTPSTDPKTYQYIYVGNINDLPSDVLTEESIVNDLSTGGTDKPLSAEQGRTLNSHVNYTTCGSNAGDQVKLISDDGFELSTHLRLLVKMNNTNTHATPKFNINNTGIKDVWYNGSVASDTNTWSADEVLDVYYDGSKYIANTHGGAQFSTGEKVGDVGIDNEPTAGSENLIESGGVADSLNICRIRNGSLGNYDTPTQVCTACVATRGCMYVSIEISRPNTSGCHYLIGYATTTSFEDIGKITVQSTFVGLNRDNIPTVNRTIFKMRSNEVGLAITIAEVDENGNANTLRANMFNDYEVRLTPSNFINNIADEIGNISSNLTEVNEFIDSVEDNIVLINGVDTQYRKRNGSQGNPDNQYVISMFGKTTNAIPVKQGEKYKLKISREPSSGFNYYYLICTYNTNNPSTLNSSLVRNEANYGTAKHSIDEPITIMEGELGLSIQITEAVGPGVTQNATNNKKLRTNSFQSGELLLYLITDSLVEINQRLDNVESEIDELQTIVGDNAYSRNKDKKIALDAACRFRKSSNTSKDCQILIVTDSHADNVAVENSAVMANGFNTVDIVLHCGDMEGDYMTPNDNMTAFIKAMNVCTKPWFNVIGNHEAGTYNMVGYVPSIQHMYDVLIKPMVDKGLLVSGEYEIGKCHYYHDFTAYNIRMIIVNEYDGDLALDDTYWEAITYDASAPEIAFGTTYQAGTILKMKGGYTDYCFKAKQEVTLSSSIYNINGQQPKYKAIPGYRMLSQSQAQWFLDTLASTPANYAVVVVMHNPFSDTARTQPSLKFNQSDIDITGNTFAQNYIQNDFFADAVDAFVNGISYSAKIVFKSGATYRNVLNDGTIDYAYEVSKDFSQKNTGVKFMCFLGGHCHKDLVWRHPTYTNQYQVTPICATTDWHQSPTSDIRRSGVNGLDYDSITTVSFDADNSIIRLVKIGVDVTQEMEGRDFEKIEL